MAGGRNSRLRNLVARNSYANSVLSQSDPSASTSRTSSSRDNVPESQTPAAAPYVPPQAYDPDAYYPQSLIMMTLLHTILSRRLYAMTRPEALAWTREKRGRANPRGKTTDSESLVVSTCWCSGGEEDPSSCRYGDSSSVKA
ncbi:hypothetical protein Bca52824_035603 [Brassica carinata]|uniref:Uncharacterized protein n=1 Tax=Brassica carinata TaxID=52824 RepID=A0A8X7V2W7_BRACI|nr:hypothetical protein Bca52824_035603 [Brassica carinata]